MRTPGQRGKVGQWLVDERTARGWTQREALAYLRAAGILIAESVYASYESGTRMPMPERLAKLEEFFGSQAERSGGRDTLPDLSSLLERLDRQAELMTDLVAALRPPEEAGVDLEARVRAVEATMRLLHPELDGRAPGAHSVPRARGG